MIYRDQLEAVYALIEKPENWTQHVIARDADDFATDPLASGAKCWCLVGAAYRVMNDKRIAIQEDLEEALDVADVAELNDNSSHIDVLALLTSAISRAPVRPMGDGK